MYRCPLCQLPLSLDGRSYRCANGHCFDIAKEGYVNLLPVQEKKSRQPGDNKAMVRARRAFLAQGYYAQLSEALNRFALDCLDPGEAVLNILDLGCGEGYYTDRLEQALRAARGEGRCRLWGLDISKEAIRLAAKANRRIHYSVASSYRLPFEDASMDLLLRIYAPAGAEECHRVLKPGTCLITASPGPAHLLGLKQLIYDQAQPHGPEPVPQGFSLERREHIGGQLCLEGAEAIGQLLLMTPYYYNLDPQTQARVQGLSRLETHIEFSLSVYRRDSAC